MEASVIYQALSDYPSPEEAIASGRFLFHGTGEPFTGSLRVGGYDGVCWTAQWPSIAQTYIPECGLESGLGMPSCLEMRESVVPDPNSPWYALVRQMGHACENVVLDDIGRPFSYRIPKGYPTYGDVVDYLQGELGYQLDPGSRIFRLKMGFVDRQERVFRADYRRIGRLFITLSDGLGLTDLRRGAEGDLMDVDYHRLGDFGRAQVGGARAITINDFCQTRIHGNVGHISIGLLPAELETRSWIEIPAMHFEWGARERCPMSTPEFSALHAAHVQECADAMSMGF